MERTIGYTVTATLPVTIAYTCSKCGYRNIQTVTLTEEVYRHSKEAANRAAEEALKGRITSLVTSCDYEGLKEASISGKCCNCKNVEKWSHKEGISKAGWGRIAAFFLLLCIFVPVFYDFLPQAEWITSISQQTQNIIAIVSIVLVVAFLIVMAIILQKKRKKRPVNASCKPIIVGIGRNITNTNEGRALYQLNMFLEYDEKALRRKLMKCKKVTRIIKRIDDIKQMYPLVFSEGFVNAMISATQRVGTEEERKQAAIKLYENVIEALKQDIPNQYLNCLIDEE